MNICLATPDFFGPIRNGGVGTAFLGLVESLNKDPGISITVLYSSDYYQVGDEQQWKEHYARQGITFVQLPKITDHIRFQEIGPGKDYVMRSYRLFRYLQENPFDILHLPDYLGLGYYTVMAKRLGFAFQDMSIVVTAHGPVAWSRQYNYMTFDNIQAIVPQTMERYVVEHADALISPSQFLLDWLRGKGWTLPENSYHAFNAMPAHTLSPDIAEAAEQRHQDVLVPDELVFFGRIEQRKGIYLYLDTIASLLEKHPDKVGKLTFTFMGHFNEASITRDLFARRMMKFDIAWKVIDNFNAEEAQNYLTSGRRLAIIPSLMDNSPCTIAECLYRGIPFITTDVGGNSEMIADRSFVSQPTLDDLSEKILKALTAGIKPSRSIIGIEEAGERLTELHREIYKKRPQVIVGDNKPMVSVCVVHRDRPKYLIEALNGFQSQTYRNFEVLIADNGSTSNEAIAVLNSLEEDKHPDYDFPIRIFRNGENRFPSLARNMLAEQAKGEILKFHDDDNVSKPHELECFVKALVRGAELVTCSLDFFHEGEDYLAPQRVPHKVLIFLSDGGGLSYLYNVLGDTNFAVWKSVFQKFGGFENTGFLYHAEDWFALCKAKAAGVKIETIPEPLIWYRADKNPYATNWRKRDVKGARFRAIQALSQKLPDEIRDLLLYLSGIHHNRT